LSFDQPILALPKKQAARSTIGWATWRARVVADSDLAEQKSLPL